MKCFEVMKIDKAIQVYPPNGCIAAEQVWEKFEEARTTVGAWAEKHGTEEEVDEVLFLKKPDTGGPNRHSESQGTERGTQTGGLLVVATAGKQVLRLEISFRYKMWCCL